jgi:hypothetical protein
MTKRIFISIDKIEVNNYRLIIDNCNKNLLLQEEKASFKNKLARQFSPTLDAHKISEFAFKCLSITYVHVNVAIVNCVFKSTLLYMASYILATPLDANPLFRVQFKSLLTQIDENNLTTVIYLKDR